MGAVSLFKLSICKSSQPLDKMHQLWLIKQLSLHEKSIPGNHEQVIPSFDITIAYCRQCTAMVLG
jgi:hypothetical protein